MSVEAQQFEIPRDTQHAVGLNPYATREQMEGVRPGSPDEQAILEQVRAAKRLQSGQIGHEAIQGFKPAEGQLQYVPPDVSRHAHHAAVEHVTGEHQIPVRLH